MCLEFPTWKNPGAGGPPYGLRPEFYIAHLGQPGAQIAYKDDGYLVETPDTAGKADPVNGNSGKKLERIAHFRAERTHDYGVAENVDFISVWHHA